MAFRKVSLHIYCKLATGWRYRPAAYYDNGTIKPSVAVTPDGEKKFPGGRYYLHAGRDWEPVGTDPEEAKRLMELRQGETLMAAAAPNLNDPLTLAEAFDHWLADVEDGGAHPNTLAAKRRISRDFQNFAGNPPPESTLAKVTMMSEVTRRHCLQWINAELIRQKNSDRTRSVKANRLKQFLTFHRLVDNSKNPLLKKTDIPQYCEAEVREFTAEEMAKFWAACNPSRILMCRVLLTCGLRRKEVESLRWVDIDFNAGAIMIQPRPEWNFTPKKKHNRVVPVQDTILEELRESKQGSKSPLCFPTRNGVPNRKIWEFVQRTCKRAGIDMTKAHPHVFRSTYCTSLLRDGMGLPDVSYLLGHKAITTTQRYMVLLGQDELRAAVNNTRFAL